MTLLNATAVTAARTVAAAVNGGVAFAVNPDGGTTFLDFAGIIAA